MADQPADITIIPIASCTFSLTKKPWDFADRNARAIDMHWEKASAERPKLFNGIIHLLASWQVSEGKLSGTFLRTDFKSFLYWRETGYGDAGVKDAFGSSLICSADGAVLLGRQTEGNMNAGLAYPPSGMIDVDDVGPNGIDIDTNVARELGEECGLGPSELDRVPGYLVAFAGPLVAIAIEWRSKLDAEALRARMLKHVRSQHAPELADVVIVRGRGEIDAVGAPPYARALLGRILSA